MAFSLPSLTYAYDALEPHIDARTMEIHHSKHHHSNEIACEDYDGMCGDVKMADYGFEPSGVDLCYKNVANRSRADAAAACMQLGEDSIDGCATQTYNSLGECKRWG